MTGVSVIIPAFNGCEFIGEAIRSAYAQTLLPAEIIVVDDVSTDGTADLVEKMSKGSPVPLRVIRLSRNSGGPAQPINAGIEAASCDLISVLDQDDVFMPKALQQSQRAMSEQSELVCVFGYCGGYGADAEGINPELVIRELLAGTCDGGGLHQVPGRTMLRQLLVHGNFTVGWPAFTFRKRLWKNKPGGAAVKLQIASDLDFLCWLSTQGDFGVIPEIRYLRRAHAGNLCNNSFKMEIEDFQVKSAYALHTHLLIRDKELRAKLWRQSLDLGYELRLRSQYAQAARCLLFSSLCKPDSWAGPGAMLKLAARWIMQSLDASKRPASTFI